jgi:hypothetical protein
MQRKLRPLIWGALTILIGTSRVAYGETRMPELSNTTICVGRFLIDLPPNTHAVTSTVYQLMESQIPARVHDLAEVKERLTQRANVYRAVPMHRVPNIDRSWRAAGFDPDKVYATTQLIGFEFDPALQQAVLGYHPDPNSAKVVVELHKVAGQKDYIFEAKNVAGANLYSQTYRTMWTAGTTFQPLALGTMPRGPGFCVEGGMFSDTGKPPVRESATLVVTFADHPDLRFVLDANAIDKVNEDEPSLKFRVDSELSVLRAGISGHVNVLERGALTAAGQDGYQIAVSAPYDLVPNTRILKFFWSADGVPNDVTRPFMEVEMTVQPTNDGQSTIRDDSEARELWKQLMQGIRVRPGAV